MPTDDHAFEPCSIGRFGRPGVADRPDLGHDRGVRACALIGAWSPDAGLYGLLLLVVVRLLEVAGPSPVRGRACAA